jgi:hypothetical protein
MIYTFIFLIIIGIFLNTISQKYVLHNVFYKREISKNVVDIDEEFEIMTVVENKKILPVTFIQVVEKFPTTLNFKLKAVVQTTADFIVNTSTMQIMPYQRIKRSYKVFCGKRGRYLFRDVTLVGGDLLGINNVDKNIEYSQEIVVLPQAADLSKEIMPYGDYNGDYSVKRWIIDDPILTIGLREYTGSESYKTIHWPSSLKSGRLMVKKFDFTAENTVMMLLNIECSKPFYIGINQEKIEKCISIARTIIEQFEEASIPYGLMTNSQYCGGAVDENCIERAGSGVVHFNNTLENLGRIDTDACMGFEELLIKLIDNIGNFTTFVIITPSILEPYIDPINIVSKKIMKAMVISLKDFNLEHLNDDIQTFIERG